VHWTRGGISLAVALLLCCALPAPAAAGSQTLTMRFGPVDMHGYETRSGGNRVPAPRIDGFITAMHAQLVDSRGRAVPQERVMLHHVFFANEGRFDGDRRGGDCANRGSQTFYGTGEENQAIEFPAGYGYRIRRGDRWRLGWMFMNHRHSAARVYLQYTVTVTDSPRLTPVTPYWISVSCAFGKIYSVPGGAAAGAVHTRSRTWVVPRSGRIVTAGAHAHGGALRVSVTKRGCGEMFSSDARYGGPADPIYQLSPVLHEPSPRSMAVVTSATGWPVSRGQRLRVTSTYSGEHPHSAVMGIMHLYIAPGLGRGARCPAQPQDVRVHRLPFPGAPGRDAPPLVTPELSELGFDGIARPVAALPGPVQVASGDVTVAIKNAGYSPRKLSVPSGATIRWRFQDPIRHDVTLAGGPRAFASYYLLRGASYSKRLTTPGEYRIFCSLHPVAMAQTIEVRP
jgi:plastocyanin